MIKKRVSNQDIVSSMCISFGAGSSSKILLSAMEKIHIGVLSENKSIPFDVYAEVSQKEGEENEEPAAAIICLRNRVLSREQLAVLKNRKIDIYVHKSDIEGLKKYLKDSIKGVAKNKDIDRKEKSLLLSSTAAMVMEQLFENADSKEAIEDSKALASEMLEDIMRDNTAFLSMVSVLSHDYYTYSHCVNVCVYAITIGKKLGVRGSGIEELACGAMLHDVGKSRIDPLILNKQGKLTTEEFDVMKSHPDEGIRILQALGEKNQNILECVVYHHEKVDGSGYPKSLNSETLPLLPQIVAVADIFDALTTKRSYKEAMSSFSALTMMKNSMANGLNPKALEALAISFKPSFMGSKSSLL